MYDYKKAINKLGWTQKEIIQQLQQLGDKSSKERKEKIYKLIRKLKDGQQ